MATSYRCLLRAGDLQIEEFKQVAYDWLRSLLGLDPDGGDPGSVRTTWQASGDAARLIIFDDDAKDEVSVLLTRSGEPQLLVEHNHPGLLPGEGLPLPAAPGLVGVLVAAVGQPHAIDPFIDEIGQLRTTDGSALMDALSRADRPVLLMATTSDGAQAGSRLRAIVDDRMVGTARSATVSAAAVDLLLPVLPDLASLRPGGLALLLPGAQVLADVVPTSLVSNQPEAAVRRMQRACLRWASSRPLPKEVADANRQLSALTGVGRSSEELLEELIAAEDSVRQEREASASAQEERDDAWLEQDEALQRVNEALSRVRFLEIRLRELNELPVGETDVDEDIVVRTCAESIEYASELLSWLAILTDLDDTASLDAYEKSPVWAKKAWLLFRGLNDYARAKQEGHHTGNLLAYANDPPQGAIPLGAHDIALGESESTENNPKTRSLRTFRVHAALSGDGHMYMGAHLKVDQRGSPAPRIHFYDDTAGRTGKLHIGYFGPHLATGG